jgi:alcohol dehydrogenase class IV
MTSLPITNPATGATIAEVAIDDAAAVADMCHQTNPRPCTAADFERLFAEAM